MESFIFGAKSVAIGIYRALKEIRPEVGIAGFLVSSLENNPSVLDGLPVLELDEISAKYYVEDRKKICIYIAVPEILHGQITESLNKYGFTNYIPIDSVAEAEWMEKYYTKLGKFPSLHLLSAGEEMAELSVYAAQFFKDKKLEHPPVFQNYVKSILLGCDSNRDEMLEKKVDFCDNRGDHISFKNPDYCEMTAFYWVWKNRIAVTCTADYVGIYHYRRMLDITEEDRKRLLEHQVDAVLPFPMIHLPDIREHHGRYMREEEWQIMLTAMRELYPEYADAYEDIFSGIYLYNYNLVLAKKEVFANYCAWVFPLLFRTEELCVLKGVETTNRYLAYMSESLLTLYFLYHKELKIYHTGRILFT